VRLLYSGQLVSAIGRQLTVVAAPIQVFELTGSTLAVGLLGLAQFPTLFVGSMLGGTLSDAFDRRRLLLATQVVMGATSLGLAFNAMLDAPTVWAVFLFTSLNAFFSGIDSPARTATIPRLVSAELLPAAFSLQVLLFQSANAGGPIVAGVVIAQAGLAAAYWVDAVSFAIAFALILPLVPLPPEGGGTRPGIRSLGEGFRFLRSKQELKGVFVIDINAMVFGLPRALFPELGLTTFGGTATTVGFMFAAPGIGAMLAGLTSGWVGEIRRAGRATVVAVVAWGIGIAAFGFTTNLVAALVFLGIAGAGDAISAIFRNTILQLTTPDRLRGRLSAVQIAVVSGGPRLGDMEAGVVAAGFGPRVAAWSGGLASAVGALVVAGLMPRFRDWEPPPGTDRTAAQRRPPPRR
jgi:MFS family permease